MIIWIVKFWITEFQLVDTLITKVRLTILDNSVSRNKNIKILDSEIPDNKTLVGVDFDNKISDDYFG